MGNSNLHGSTGPLPAPKVAKISDVQYLLVAFSVMKTLLKNGPMPNGKHIALGRPKGRFYARFAQLLLTFPMPFREKPKPHILQQVSNEMLVFTFQASYIGIKNQTKIMFSQDALLDRILDRIFLQSMLMKVWFRPSFGTRWGQNCAPNRPRGAKKLQNESPRCSQERFWNQLLVQRPPEAPYGSIFNVFWEILGPLPGHVLHGFWTRHSADDLQRFLISPLPSGPARANIAARIAQVAPTKRKINRRGAPKSGLDMAIE